MILLFSSSLSITISLLLLLLLLLLFVPFSGALFDCISCSIVTRQDYNNNNNQINSHMSVILNDVDIDDDNDNVNDISSQHRVELPINIAGKVKTFYFPPLEPFYCPRFNDKLSHLNIDTMMVLSMLSDETHVCFAVFAFCRNHGIVPNDCMSLLINVMHYLQSIDMIESIESRSTSGEDIVERRRECLVDYDAMYQQIEIENNRRVALLREYSMISPSNENYIFTSDMFPIRIAAYLVIHDEIDADYFSNVIAPYLHRNSWLQSLSHPSSKLFEYLVYSYPYLPQFESHWNQDDVEYILIADYKVVEHFSPREIEQLVDIAMKYDFDFVPLYRSVGQLLPDAASSHGSAFRNAWYALLKAMGYPVDVIEKFSNLPVFARNSFLVKKDIMLKLIEFMALAQMISSENERIVNLLSVNAEYVAGDSLVAQRVFGSSYYQLHPFIFERLPIFFANYYNYSVCIEDSLCPFNVYSQQ